MEKNALVMDSENIYHAFLTGAHKIIHHRHDLNKINVFPVQDGDTGNNLSSMMKTIIDEAEKRGSVKGTMESMSEAALKGARGNSGIIFAQYLNGMSAEVSDVAAITLNDYIFISLKAVEYAYNSIENPVEGTMITVMREWGEALSEVTVNHESSFSMLQKAKDRLNEALAKTQYQLSELRKAKVVDAGAKGFVLFIQGILEYLRTGKSSEEIHDDEVIDIPTHEEHHFTEGEEIKYRYCTECMIEGENLDKESMMRGISDFGDSLIVAVGKNRARMHIHTNEPARVFDFLYSQGTILYPKADDMIKQQDVVLNRKYDIALVTDSIADVPVDILRDEQIHMIHLSLMYDNNTFLDRLTIEPELILEYSREDDVLPTSSQPDEKQIENLFTYLQTYYRSVLVLTVSKELSGTNGIVSKVADRIADDDFRIKVINTKQNSGAQGLLVTKASRLIKQGLSLDEVIGSTEKDIERSKILVRVKTLDNMIKSGRLSTRAGKIGKSIGLKPIVTLDAEGKAGLFSVAFSVKGSRKKLVRHIEGIMRKSEIESYNIVHINNYEEALEFSRTMITVTGKEPEYISETSSIVAVGAGEGAIAVSYILKERK